MYDNVHFFQRLGKLTGENKERYAKRRGYDMIWSTPSRTRGILTKVACDNSRDLVPDARGDCYEEDKSFDIDHTRAPTFGKIKLTLAACIGRDDAWILWSDADAMVINQTVPLETIIDDAYDLIYSVDWLMLNAGMLLMKCSKWSIDFLNTVYNARKFDHARALDQSALQSYIDNLSVSERRAHIKIIPKHAMDVYTEEYVPGDFLIHFAGKLYEATEPGLFAIANQYDILSMVDDVEDIEAFFRGRRFLNYFSGTCNTTLGDKSLACEPEDPRRILLNESLGSMSVPNRYRHVGLRYYWLGKWKDIYDTSDWDVFKMPLKIPSQVSLANGVGIPRPPFVQHEERPQAEDDDNGVAAGAGAAGGAGGAVDGDANGGNDDDDGGNIKDDDAGDVALDLDGGHEDKNDDDKQANKDGNDIDDGPNDDKVGDAADDDSDPKAGKEKAGMDNDGTMVDDDDDPTERSGAWKAWLGGTAIGIAVAWLYMTVKRRSKMYSKTQ